MKCQMYEIVHEISNKLMVVNAEIEFAVEDCHCGRVETSLINAKAAARRIEDDISGLSKLIGSLPDHE